MKSDTDQPGALEGGERAVLTGNPLLEAALDYAARGWPVLPLHSPRADGSCDCGRAPGKCKPAKHPRTQQGLTDASTDPKTIRSWWQKWPNANVGVRTGGCSGLVAIDLDGPAGRDSFFELEAQHGDCAPTVTANTGRGVHLLFAHRGAPIKSRAAIGGHVGIDVRGEGGYIVAPPSLHASGRQYEWAVHPDDPKIQMQPMAPWLLEILAAPSNGRTDRQHAVQAGDRIAEGVRNDFLTRRGGAMRRAGMEQASIEAGLLAENSARCVPPLREDEVRGIAASVARYRPALEHGSAVPVEDLLRISGLDALGQEPQPSAVERALVALRDGLIGADPLQLALARHAAVRSLKRAGLDSPAEIVKAALPGAVKGEGDAIQGRELVAPDLEPWPSPVDIGVLLDDLVSTFLKYLVLPTCGAEAMALWVVHTHSLDATDTSPILAITSATKRAGKTTALRLLGAVVHRPMMASNVTPAAVYRAVEKCSPTLLVDEADSFLKDNEELRGVLNSSHTRRLGFVIRCVGDVSEPRRFSTWCPKAIALIGDLPETLEDRAIVLTLRRKRRDERVGRLRDDRLDKDMEPLLRRATRWAKDNLDRLRDADPTIAPDLNDRAADNWRPLFAIADLCGGAWPERARQASSTLSAAVDEAEASPQVQVLIDISAIFAESKLEAMSSAVIASTLAERDDRPWHEWRRGKPITPSQVARLLRPHGIRPLELWIDGAKTRGYELADFADAFGRYLPAPSVEPVEPVEVVDAASGAHSGHTGTTGESGRDQSHEAVGTSPTGSADRSTVSSDHLGGRPKAASEKPPTGPTGSTDPSGGVGW